MKVLFSFEPTHVELGIYVDRPFKVVLITVFEPYPPVLLIFWAPHRTAEG